MSGLGKLDMHLDPTHPSMSSLFHSDVLGTLHSLSSGCPGNTCAVGTVLLNLSTQIVCAQPKDSKTLRLLGFTFVIV